MSIQEQFEKFYENIKLTPSQREDAIIKHTGVCKKLHDYYYPTIEYNGSSKLLIGSYAKHTHIRPARDIDVIFIMPEEKFEQYDDNKSNGQSQLLQDVKKILEEKYPDTIIRAFGKVVVLEFSETKHDIELLPAWEKEDGTFVVPNSENGGSWEYWDPRSEIKKIKDSDSKTGKTKALIRMVKKWSENCSAKLKSYQIEDKILEFLSFYNFDNKEYSILNRDFFDYFHKKTYDENLKSHLSTAFNRAQKACNFEQNNNLGKAVEEWQKIFGDDFYITLITPEKGINTLSEEIPLLADYSHCKSLQWPLVLINKVSIDAYIYDKTKNINFGGINSNGRNLEHGLYLKFIAQTNIRNDFQYYWQVVNTGQEAQLSGDLRGEIFPGNMVQWEHTKYKGKHWIECFVVQNNFCIAKSDKFFINIR